MPPKKPDKNTTGKPRPAPEDVREKQDPGYTMQDFTAAIERVTRRLDEPKKPGRGSTRR